jgi:hypothetical protein
MLRESALGIAVVGPQGLAWGLAAADVVVAAINDALGLLLTQSGLSRRAGTSWRPGQMSSRVGVHRTSPRAAR